MPPVPSPYGTPPMPYYPQPMGYYPPPMVMAPVFVNQPGQKTFEGLKWLRYGTICVMAFNAMAIIGAVLAFSLVSTFNNTNPQTVLNALGALAAIVAVALIAGVLGLVSFILGLLGIYNINDGKREFGDAHLANVKDAVKWFVIACGLYVGSIVVGVVFGLSALFANGATAQQIASQFALSSAVSGGILVGYVYAVAQVMQKLVGGLMTEEGRKMKQLFVLLSLVGAAAALGVRVVSAFLFTNAFTNQNAADQVSTIGSFVGIVSIITAFIYMRQVNAAEKGARNMIASGQFNPDAPPPGQAPPPMAPPVAPAMP